MWISRHVLSNIQSGSIDRASPFRLHRTIDSVGVRSTVLSLFDHVWDDRSRCQSFSTEFIRTIQYISCVYTYSRTYFPSNFYHHHCTTTADMEVLAPLYPHLPDDICRPVHEYELVCDFF